MGAISSGVGIISGMDIQSIVTQLIAVEARPRDMLVARMEKLTNEQTALMSIQARAMAVQIAVANFDDEAVFQQKAVSSSNEDILTVSASKFATQGTYQFRVKRLASQHHFVSRGYSNRDVSVGNGTLSFEIGQGQLGRPTELSFINGQQGFHRGEISITDRAGNTAQIDLSGALTAQDVIDEINRNTVVNVTASASGDHFVITDDNTGSGLGSLVVGEVGVGNTADSLGIAGDSADGRLVGGDLLSITSGTRLGQLRDGNGVRTGLLEDLEFTLKDNSVFRVNIDDTLDKIIGDSDRATTLKSLNAGFGVRHGKFRITDQNGRSVDIDLNNLYDLNDRSDPENPVIVVPENVPLTLAHMEDYIQAKIVEKNQQLDPNYDPEDSGTDFLGMMKVAFTFDGSDHISLTDNSEPLIDPLTNQPYEQRESNFIIEDLDGGFAAADLGIVADVAGGNVSGERIWSMDTVGDVINAVNNHWDNWNGTDGPLMEVGINSFGTGLSAADLTGGEGTLTIAGYNDNHTADDLGLTVADSTDALFEGRRLIAGLNTVMLQSLNGGSAGANQITAGGTISITDRAGNSATIDMTDAFTVQDILDAINQAGTNITASLNVVGNGLLLTDNTASGDIVGNLIVADVDDGSLAQNLGLVVDDAISNKNSGNLQLQYISEATSLGDLRQGRGIRRGKLTITESSGSSFTIDLQQDRIKTLEDVIDEINTAQTQIGDGSYRSTTIRARMNDTGDGIMLEDSQEDAEGNPIENPQPIQVIDENGGYAAHDLNLTGTAKQDESGHYYIDGSYEHKFEIGGGDSIDDIVSRINNADFGIGASVINDGSDTNPYRISFTSDISGRAGNVYFDSGTTGMTTQTLAEGRDAMVLFGEGDGNAAIVMTSSDNTIENAVKGTTLELHRADDEAVEVKIDTDIDGISTQIKSFVDAYNGVMADIDAATKFDPETLARGQLFGETSVRRVQDALQAMTHRIVQGVSSNYNSLSRIGVKSKLAGTETVTNEQGIEETFSVAGTPQLEFDEDVFRTAFADDPEGIEELFTRDDVGLGDYISDLLENLAGTNDSTMQRRVDTMQDKHKMYEDRVERLGELLSAKEDRLYSQFYAMEQALASMQAQQSALNSLAGLASSLTSSKQS